MEFELNTDFAAWIDRDSATIAGQVRDITHEYPREAGSLHPDRPITKIGPEQIIGEVAVSITDATGKLSAQFFPHNGRQLGLSKDAMANAEKAVERIWSRRELVNLLSRDTVRELLLTFAGAKAREMPTPLLSTRLVETVVDRVRPVSVWVPIEEVFVDKEFSFATAILAPVSKAELDSVVENGCVGAPADQLMKLREELYSKWAGTTVMRLEFVAEPKRAQEMAPEQAADYMTLLQFYTSAAMVLPVCTENLIRVDDVMESPKLAE
jgi:hypothetical protein